MHDIVDTAVAAGSFKTLAAAVTAAGLVPTLKGAGPFTVFAPTDEAFAKLPAGTVEALLKDIEIDRDLDVPRRRRQSHGRRCGDHERQIGQDRERCRSEDQHDRRREAQRYRQRGEDRHRMHEWCDPRPRRRDFATGVIRSCIAKPGGVIRRVFFVVVI